MIGVLLLCGWCTAMLVIGLLLRYGQSAEILAWATTFMILALSGVFNPVESIPGADPADRQGPAHHLRLPRRPRPARRRAGPVGRPRAGPPSARSCWRACRCSTCCGCCGSSATAATSRATADHRGVRHRRRPRSDPGRGRAPDRGTCDGVDAGRRAAVVRHWRASSTVTRRLRRVRRTTRAGRGRGGRADAPPTTEPRRPPRPRLRRRARRPSRSAATSSSTPACGRRPTPAPGYDFSPMLAPIATAASPRPTWRSATSRSRSPGPGTALSSYPRFRAPRSWPPTWPRPASTAARWRRTTRSTSGSRAWWRRSTRSTRPAWPTPARPGRREEHASRRSTTSDGIARRPAVLRLRLQRLRAAARQGVARRPDRPGADPGRRAGRPGGGRRARRRVAALGQRVPPRGGRRRSRWWRTRSPPTPGAVDLVVGHHAHVVQPISKVGRLWVVWGMGNLLSNNSPRCCTSRGHRRRRRHRHDRRHRDRRGRSA